MEVKNLETMFRAMYDILLDEPCYFADMFPDSFERDEDGNIVMMNKAFEELEEIKKAKSVIHAHWKYKHRHYGGFEYKKYVCEDGQTHTVKIDNRWEEDTPYCSNCGKFSYEMNEPNYCPFCGAKMDEKEGS